MPVASQDVFTLVEKAYRLGAMEKGTRMLGEALENAVAQGVSLIDLLSAIDENSSEENIGRAEHLVDRFGWVFKVLANDRLIRFGGWILSSRYVHRKGVQLLTQAMVNTVRGKA